MKITGANDDSPSVDLIKQQEERLSEIPQCDSMVMIKKGGGEMGCSASSDLRLEDDHSSDQESTSTQADSTDSSEVLNEVTSVERSSSESSDDDTDDEDFLDLLVNTLDGEFDPDLLF